MGQTQDPISIEERSSLKDDQPMNQMKFNTLKMPDKQMFNGKNMTPDINNSIMNKF